MINEILLQFIAEYHQGLNELAGRGTATEQALTAIYEIGLECIGAAEELEPLNVWIEKTRNHGGTSEEYWKLYSIVNDYNNLRAEQRKAWAKACGVAEK